MDLSNCMTHLGEYFGEQSLSELLREINVVGIPKLARGDDTTFLSNEKEGIELTFKSERFLTSPAREYPEGALVLCNIRFYGIDTDTFRKFTGALPHRLAFGDESSVLTTKLGQPSWTSPARNKMRWDFSGYATFASLNNTGAAEILAFQLPVSK